MSEQWVQDNLSNIINKSPMGDCIILKKYSDGSEQAVKVSTFISLFSDVANPSYNTLCASKNGQYYKVYFDDWKSKGYI